MEFVLPILGLTVFWIVFGLFTAESDDDEPGCGQCDEKASCSEFSFHSCREKE